MNNLANKYNRALVSVFVVAPFAAFLVFKTVHIEFNFLMQLLSFVGVGLLFLFRSNTNPIIFPKYLLFYLIFILYIFYSSIFQLDREFKVKYLISEPLIGGFNYMLIIENTFFRKKHFKQILDVSKVVLIIAVLVIIVQQVVDPSFFVRRDLHILDEVTSWGTTQNRLLSIYSWIGGYLAIGFGFTPIFLLVVDDLNRHKKKVLAWVLAGIVFAFLSKARWIMVNTLLVFVLLVVNHKNKGQQIFKLLVVVPMIFVGSLFALDAAGIDASGIVEERILESDKKNINQKSASTRLLAFEAFNKFFWDQPFFGMGDKKYGMGGTGKHDYKLQRFLGKRSAQIHVGYLSLLYKFGIIGGFFFLAFQYHLLLRLYKNAKRTSMWAPFLAFLGFALGNLTQVHFVLYQMGFIIALVVDKYHRQNMLNK